MDNARKHFVLTEKEKDMILKHMWPLTRPLPRYRESFVVSLADKICATAEMLHLYRSSKVQFRLQLADAY